MVKKKDIEEPIKDDTKKDEHFIWISDKRKVVQKFVKCDPEFYKIFDKIVMSAIDHESNKENECDEIVIDINKKAGYIEVLYNGKGIPIEMNKKQKIYEPELFFCNLIKDSIGGLQKIGVLENTDIPLYNGTIKKASDIELSDILIGDDGKPRSIKKIITGESKMYHIDQGNGDRYTVSEEYILTLHVPDHKVIFWNTAKNGWTVLWWNHKENRINTKSIPVKPVLKSCKECGLKYTSDTARHYRRKHKGIEIPKTPRKPPTVEAPDTPEVKKARSDLEKFCEDITDDNTIHMSVKEYMTLNDTTKLRLAGFRGKCIEWDKKEVDLEPYLLGLWSGDGMARGYTYACYGEKDPQLIDYLTEWGTKNDATIKKLSRHTYGFSSIENYGKKGYAPLKKQLAKYDLVNNKHIPNDYIVNDRDTRLQVLAGMIDTDGTAMRDGTRIVITQGLMHKQLIEELTFLARSLGFYCSFTKKKTSWTWKGEKKKGEAYNLNISGNIEDIPTRLPRKKCNNIKDHSELTTGKITVTDAGTNKFVGFEIDENKRFLINDFTVTHDCTNIISTKFIVKTIDKKNKKKYEQIFDNNMEIINEPEISYVDKNKKSYTEITFYPDLERYGMKEGLTDDIIAFLKKRTYDLCANTRKKTNVFFNDDLIKEKSYDDSIKLNYRKT